MKNAFVRKDTNAYKREAVTACSDEDNLVVLRGFLERQVQMIQSHMNAIKHDKSEYQPNLNVDGACSGIWIDVKFVLPNCHLNEYLLHHLPNFPKRQLSSLVETC